ncbi:MAG TPA: response regulator [Kaistia sp.]|nr:response regulator [Kaistia sp.]
MRQAQTERQLGVVDDDASIRETLTGFLEGEGYGVRAAADADGLERMMRARPLDLVLLDIRLPGTDGLTLTRTLREKSELGIILITGRNDKVDRILGLEYGADDYIAKPVDERELLPRVRNLLRRVGHSHLYSPAQTLAFGRYVIDIGRRSVTAEDGEPVALTTAEFDLLCVFVRNAGQVLSRDRLIAASGHRRWDPLDRTIDTLVRRLRRKLEVNPDRPSLITTVHGVGYLLSA